MGCNKSKPALADSMEKEAPTTASVPPPPLKHGRKTSVMANPHFYDSPSHAGEKRRSTILVKANKAKSRCRTTKTPAAAQPTAAPPKNPSVPSDRRRAQAPSSAIQTVRCTRLAILTTHK